MPQLSLYIDRNMMKQLEAGAAAGMLSVSKYVSLSLKDYFSSNWPIGYFELFGSIEDETFTEHDEPNPSNDAMRECL